MPLSMSMSNLCTLSKPNPLCTLSKPNPLPSFLPEAGSRVAHHVKFRGESRRRRSLFYNCRIGSRSLRGMNEGDDGSGIPRPPSSARTRPTEPTEEGRRWRRWYRLSVAHHKLENDEKADTATRGELLLEEAREARKENRLLKKYRTQD